MTLQASNEGLEKHTALFILSLLMRSNEISDTMLNNLKIESFLPLSGKRQSFFGGHVHPCKDDPLRVSLERGDEVRGRPEQVL